MEFLFSKVERANPKDRFAPKKWYAVLRSRGRVSEKEVAKQIADETLLTPWEAEIALAYLEVVLIDCLLEGKSLQLGNWGGFYLTCNSAPSDTKEKVTAKNINKLNIRFVPGKALKEALNNAGFEEEEK